MPVARAEQVRLPDDLAVWLDAHADRIDATPDFADDVMPRLAAAGLFRAGVPEELGGRGGATGAAIDAIAAVAGHSVTAAFVFWGQRTFIEYLLQSPNAALRARLLGPLLDGELAGATGLSNAMKFLSGIESLQIDARRPDDADDEGGGYRLDGALAWVTNLRKQGFVAAAAVNMPDGAPPAVLAFDGRDGDNGAGVVRSPDLELMALRSSNTAAVKLSAVAVDDSAILAPDARAWLPRVRPAFLGMQCGLSIGLAQASLESAHALAGTQRGPLSIYIDALQRQLDDKVFELKSGVAERRFETAAGPLFRLRIALAGIVQQAAMLELQASGGRAYLQGRDAGFARRWRESAFIPIVTPSLTQLQMALDQHNEHGPS